MIPASSEQMLTISSKVTGIAAHSRSTSAGSSESDGRRTSEARVVLSTHDWESSQAWPHTLDAQRRISPLDIQSSMQYTYSLPSSMQHMPHGSSFDFVGQAESSIDAYYWQHWSQEQDPQTWSQPAVDVHVRQYLSPEVNKSWHQVKDIGFPPGLEDMFETDEAEAKLATAKLALCRRLWMDLNGTVQPFDHDAAWFWGRTMPHSQTLDLSQDLLSVNRPLSSCLGAEFLGVSSVPFPAHAMHSEPAHDKENSEPFEYPSVGSRAHPLGTCTPCTFVYTKGCANGSSCQFCHLCDAGERKRRAKLQRAAKKRTAQGQYQGLTELRE